MSEKVFDRDAMVKWYVDRHFKTDPGITQIYHLPANAPEREIRLLEVNDQIVDREADPSEPIDFGVDIGSESAHTLMVVDVTPTQWERIRKDEIKLPDEWTLDCGKEFTR